MRQTILLTGATGFLGSHLLESLVHQELDVIILKRTKSNTWRIDHLLDKVKIWDIDSVNFETVFSDKKVDIVINTVCSYGRTNESLIDIVNTNLIFGLNLLEEAVKNKVKTFINTDSLLPRNLNDYSLSKAQFTDWLYQRSEKIQVVNFKIEHMYGPKDDVSKFVPWVILQFKENIPEIKLTEGEQFRDFIYIDDVVSAYLGILEKVNSLGSFSQFDVGTGILISVKDFLEKLKKCFEIVCGLNTPKLVFGAIPYRTGEMMTVEVNIKPLLDLGWQPKTSIEEGIEKSLKNLI
jgi:nucleoside-diphosphate-sugar epimerase